MRGSLFAEAASLHRVPPIDAARQFSPGEQIGGNHLLSTA